MIEVRTLRVVYGRTIALDGIDLELEPGIVGLFGPNGSGKTTLLRALAGLVRPAAGSVLIDGTSPAGARGRIGYAGHTSGLYPRLTVSENLELFARLHAAAHDRIPRMLEELRLTHRKDTRVGELSAGLKSRVAIARALVHDPDVLLLDEPYANQDEDAAELVSDALKASRRDGRIAIVATHGAKRLKAFADARVVVRRGHLVGSFSAEDIAQRTQARG